MAKMRIAGRTLLLLSIGLGAGCGGPSPESPIAVAPSAGDTAVSALVTPVRVRVASARRGDVQRQATVDGVVAAYRKATVAAETNGRVVRRTVEPGDSVPAGKALLALDSERALIARDQASAGVRTRQIDLQQAGNELRRGQDLRRQEFISEDALEQLKFAEVRAQAALAAAQAELAAAERVLADAEVRAPFPGIVEVVHVHEGDYLSPGTPVATLVDFSKVRIKAGVTAREATLLRDAGQIELTLDALGPGRLRGTVNSVARMADAATGTYTLEVWLEVSASPTGGLLREGMLAVVYLPHAGVATHLAVPSTAVFRRDGTMHVFVVKDRRATLRAVRLGHTNGSTIEVLEGLTVGDLVVTEGQFALRDDAPVTFED